MALSLRYQFWCWRKFASEVEIRLAHKLSKPGTLSLDVGANAGAYSYFMWRAGATVHAFEPIPELGDKLASRYGNKINLHRLGISDHTGAAEIKAPLINGQPAYGLASVEQEWPSEQSIQHSIQLKTIDSFDFSNLGVLKIDIEGHENAALRGASNTLQTSRPFVVIEAEERHRPGAVQDVWGQLKTHDYCGGFIQNRRFQDISTFTVAKHQHQFGSPEYVFNFVFYPREQTTKYSQALGV